MLNASDPLSYEFASLLNGTSGAKYEWYRTLSPIYYDSPGLEQTLRSNTFTVNTGGAIYGVYFQYRVIVSPTTQQYSDNVGFTSYITPNVPGEPMPKVSTVITVNYQKKGTPKGNSTFLFRGADGYNYLVKSNSWAVGGLTFYNTTAASFSGKCVIQKIDRSTGLVVESNGNCFFTVDILDGDLEKPKASDMYAITVLSGGLVWHQVGAINAPVGIGGGNIVVHSK